MDFYKKLISAKNFVLKYAKASSEFLLDFIQLIYPFLGGLFLFFLSEFLIILFLSFAFPKGYSLETRIFVVTFLNLFIIITFAVLRLYNAVVQNSQQVSTIRPTFMDFSAKLKKYSESLENSTKNQASTSINLAAINNELIKKIQSLILKLHDSIHKTELKK